MVIFMDKNIEKIAKYSYLNMVALISSLDWFKSWFNIDDYTLNFAKNNMETIIKKIYNNLNDGGVFVTSLDEVEDDFSKPIEIIVSWLPYVFNEMDLYLIKDYIRNTALNVGFKEIKLRKDF